ncbi:Pyruvate/Phosphoenolpyruvate kinase-like domain-containing protein [Xylariaceae sp. FL1019]|nr:Pyruvate/Phosphoenolpyruvate kinase-like domain-containing protein [Xylariaceae sp. FL1019]
MGFTPLRTTFEAGSKAFGFWLCLPTAAGAKTILRSAASISGGFSWVLVDAEHGLITDKDYYELVNAIAAEGASPIIRVPWNEEWMIKRALDAGAHGVLTPMCHTPVDAERIVKFSKYPPSGSRGYGPMLASHTLPIAQGGAVYDASADKNLLVMVQIESKSGVDHVEEIAKVEGLDVLLIGPFDLAKQLNVTHGGQEHEAAITRILKGAKSAGKIAAIFCTSGAQARARLEQGFDMVSVIPDLNVLGDGMAHELKIASGDGSNVVKQQKDSY